MLKGTDGYIFTAEWYQLPTPAMTDISSGEWQAIVDAKDIINKAIEDARTDKNISGNLTAKVAITAPAQTAEILAKLGDELRFVFITSDATVTTGDALSAVITPADGSKCVRCWHIRTDVGQDSSHPEICTRCVENLGDGEVRHYA